MQTGQEESLKNSSAIPFVGNLRAYRMTSASPAWRSKTPSVPITSIGALGRTFLQRGRRGTSQRLAKAFVVVTRRGCLSRSRWMVAIAVENASMQRAETGRAGD